MSKTMQLSHEKIAAMLLIEGQLQSLQVAANQLESFVKYPDGAKVIADALKCLNDGYKELHRAWANGIIIAPAGAEKTLVAP